MSPTPFAFLSRAVFAIAIIGLPLSAAVAADGDNVRVSVVAVLATDKNDKVDPKIDCIAKEAQKHDPKLTGFRIAHMTTKPLTIGGKDDFELCAEQCLHVVVEKKGDEEGRFQMRITPPQMGDITYTTTCGKFFPVMTPYRNKAGELLIIGVRIQPCNGK
jgi:hypothetical protein